MFLDKNSSKISTCVYRKPTDKDLLLHYQSLVDHRYKTILFRTMLNRGYRLSSSWQLFSDECEKLKTSSDALNTQKTLLLRILSTLFNQMPRNHHKRNAREKPSVLFCRTKIRSLLTCYGDDSRSER